MPNLTTTDHPPNAIRPSTMSNSAYRTLGVIKNAIVRGPKGEAMLPQSAMPRDAERSWMADRVRALSIALTPATAAQIRIEVAKIFTVMASRTTDEDNIRGAQIIYAEDLGDLPQFAIAAAGSDFRRGNAGDGKWAPTPAELRARAIHHVKPFKDELADLRMVLEAKPLLAAPGHQTAEERAAAIARVRAMVGRTVESMTAAVPKNEAALIAEGVELEDLGPPRRARDMRTEAEIKAAAEARLAEMEAEVTT